MVGAAEISLSLSLIQHAHHHAVSLIEDAPEVVNAGVVGHVVHLERDHTLDVGGAIPVWWRCEIHAWPLREKREMQADRADGQQNCEVRLWFKTQPEHIFPHTFSLGVAN